MSPSGARDEDDVIGQADALMRRYRSFVARPANEEEEKEPAEAPDAEIPLLTEVVDADTQAPLNLAEELDQLRDEIDQALSDWLVEMLPAAVANASQQILAELDAKARNTLLPRLREIIAARRDRAGSAQPL